MAKQHVSSLGSLKGRLESILKVYLLSLRARLDLNLFSIDRFRATIQPVSQTEIAEFDTRGFQRRLIRLE